MEETEHHGDFLGGIIWRLQTIVLTLLAPLLSVREFNLRS